MALSRLTRALAASIALLTLAPPAAGDIDGSGLCLQAGRAAAAARGVPPDLMTAIARVESGRGPAAAPWPWAANIDGAPRYLPTRDAALRAVSTALADGARQVDVGCFQMNLRWHGDRFRSLQAAFDPATNAHAAAAFLAELHADLGDWPAAIGAYHSRDPARARAYRQRVAAMLDAAPPPPQRLPAPPRLAAATAPGSLVPLASSARPLLGR